MARRLGFLYLDTGAMYRAVALAFRQADRPATVEAAKEVLPSLHLDVHHDESGLRLLLNGKDVTEAIRAPEVGMLASAVATLASVRQKLLVEQRRIGHAYASHGGVILDGRDIGTVVFPDADVKIFMVADVEERARRRRDEMADGGTHVSLEEVAAEIRERDRQDRERALAPLRCADDAVVLDTTDRTFDEQVQFVIDQVRERPNKTLV